MIKHKHKWPRMRIAIPRCLENKKYRCLEDKPPKGPRGKHKGKEIWILGTGVSLDRFPDDFFDDKISIAVKAAFLGFENCTYNLAAYLDRSGVMGYLKEHSLFGLLDKFIITLRTDYTDDFHWFGKYQYKPIYMRVFKDRKARYLDEAIKNIMIGRSCNYPGVNTGIHFGIQVAAVMGASKIYLVGCEHNTQLKKQHAEKGKIGDFYRERRGEGAIDSFELPVSSQLGTSSGWQEARLGTRRFAELLQHYGVEVVRYYYDIGEEKIIGEEDSKQRYIEE